MARDDQRNHLPGWRGCGAYRRHGHV